MAWTTPGTAVAGEVLTAAFWNEQVRDNLRALRDVQDNVVYSYDETNTVVNTTASSWVDISANLSVTITPSSSTSKILIVSALNFAGTANDTAVRLLRGSTAIGIGTGASGGVALNVTALARTDMSTTNIFHRAPVILDSPATTSATTYKWQWNINTGNIRLNRRSQDTNFTTYSAIMAMEIAV